MKSLNRPHAVLIGVLTLLVAAIAAFGISRQDGGVLFTKTDLQANDIKYVAAAGANVSAADSVHYRMSSAAISRGDLILQLDMDLNENQAVQGYGQAKGKGPKGEITYEFASDGTNVFMKLIGGTWEKRTFEDIGVDKNAATKNFDFVSAPGSKVENLPNVTENGVALRHLRVTFAPETVLQRMRDVYTSGSIRMATDLATIDRAGGEYFIRVSDGMPQRSIVSLEYSVMGQKFSSTTRVEYLDFNTPVKLPSDLPK
jgi:hypothetical protein